MLLRLIADGCIKSKIGDANTTYKIMALNRNEFDGLKSYVLENGDVKVLTDDQDIRSIKRDLVKDCSSLLLERIRTLKSTQSIDDDELQNLLDKLECNQLKAKSTDKSDIKIVVHDHLTGLQPELGFSVKSKVGGDSTILNASGATKFTYSINGTLTEEQLGKLDSLHHYNKKKQKSYEVRKIIAELYNYNASLEFDKVEHKVARANFLKLDCCLPELLAHCLLLWFKDGIKEIHEVATAITKNNPLNLPVEDAPDIYIYKLKKLLLEIVLGMKPATHWNGEYDATGGFIVIEEDGEIVCYHLIQHNLLEDYLFYNTYLDTPSSAKFASYGEIYNEDGINKIQLTLQIRFRDRLKI